MRRYHSATLALGILLTGIALQAAERADLKKLTDQLIGREGAAAPRTPEQLDAAYGQVLDALLPDMASEDVAKHGPPADAMERIAFHACRPGADAERAACAKAIAARLGPQVATPARVWLIRQLERMGRAEAVPPLAKALADKDPLVRESARRALQNNPAKEAGAALQEALASAAEPAWRVALLNALAERRDAANLGLLLKEAAAENDDVRTAAVVGLAKIGDKSASETIAAAMQRGSPRAQRAAVNAYLMLAKALAAKGDKPAALAMYKNMLAAGALAKCAALVGIGRAGSAADLPTILAAAADDDARVRGACVEALGLFEGPEAAAAIVARLPAAKAETKVTLLRALVLRGDRSAAPALAAAAEDPDETVRVAAITGLGTMGNAGAVPLLLKAAATSGKAQEAARQSLLVLSGAEVDKALLAALDGQGPEVRVEAMRAVAARRAVAATAALLKAAADADADVRTAAIKALGVMAPNDALPALTAVLVKTEDENSRKEVANALVLIANRNQDMEARAEPLLKGVASASGPAKHALLGVLGRIGGQKSLACVTAALKGGDDKMKDAAIRALAEWPDATAAPDLLAVYQEVADETQQGVAFRGYVRVCRSMPEAERATLLVAGLRAAKRPAQKKEVLGALGEARHLAALEAVVACMDDEAVKEEAAAAAVRLGRDLGERHPGPVKAALKKALQVSTSEHVQREGKEALERAERKSKD